MLLIRSCTFGQDKYDFALDEDLANYFDALPGDERLTILRTEKYYRKYYDTAVLTDEALDRIENAV